ncbi:MAG: polymer-forming cytoskeletal protein [Candidatus Latescibacteria bacterium]|nr:polymer-forming cytoskeletal protein [Candidatus Latescibacterota bacterium]
MAKQNGGELNTIIGKGSSLEGTFSISSSLRVDGTIKGKLTVGDSLAVGKGGVIEADIKTKKATVAGKIIGTLEASERVVLESTSTLQGDLKTKLLIIEEGAVFTGNCQSGKELKELAPTAIAAEGEQKKTR